MQNIHVQQQQQQKIVNKQQQQHQRRKEESKMVDSSSVKRNDDGKRFICIECGSNSDSLFTEFSGGIKKLKHCELCQKLVDKFIEYDNVLILLDILLHKPQAYRHLLFNCEITVLLQLFILNILCDTYMRWITFHQFYLSESPASKDWHLLVELQFYKMLAITIAELFVNALVTTCLVLFSQHRAKVEINRKSFQSALRVLIISSYGKLLAIPSLIWGQENSYWCLWLTRIFVMTSNAEAIKVTSRRSFGEALSYVICGLISGYLLEEYAIQALFIDWANNGSL